MPQKLLRGRVLNFVSEPKGAEDHNAYIYLDDGAILIENGLIVKTADYGEFKAFKGEVIDHHPHLLMAGFIDMHIHFPQTQVIASWGAQLLDWLEDYTFPEESRYYDLEFSEYIAKRFYDELIRNGTTSAMAFCTVHKNSVDAYFSEAKRRKMRMFGGKVMMDRNAPKAVLDTAMSSYEDSQQLIETWHHQDRLSYVVTPRFAITSTPAQLEVAGVLLRENPTCYLQTHLSENMDEIKLTLSLYPKARDYLDIYESYGLLGTKSFFGHSIHLEDREIEAMASTGSHPVFCPTSNLFLGSGLFDREGLRSHGIESGVATDVGGGTSYSMLQTLSEGYKILQLRGQKLHPLQAFHWMTRGNAIVLGMEDKIGTLDPGTEADIIVLDCRATPAMALRSERSEDLAEELFILQIMGDDRAIKETYIAGIPMKSDL